MAWTSSAAPTHFHPHINTFLRQQSFIIAPVHGATGQTNPILPTSRRTQLRVTANGCLMLLSPSISVSCFPQLPESCARVKRENDVRGVFEVRRSILAASGSSILSHPLCVFQTSFPPTHSTSMHSYMRSSHVHVARSVISRSTW